jgi:SAM-dependent methyltransferase
MQNDSGLHSLLALPLIYTVSQELIGAHRWRKKFIREVVRPADGDKVIDIGCGPAQMLAWLPEETCYAGLDVSAAYIESAKKRYGRRGVFLTGHTGTLRGHEALRDADIVLCCGVLHHLNDSEATDVFSFAREALRAGGRFCALETAWLPGQSRASRWMVGQDRGKNVRTPEEYRVLAERHFTFVNIKPDLHPLRIPYAGLTMECRK